ncbi:hypothetical protein NC651_011316 [Populus alba x Populus x berolinensis]|nr:hypothetical protein NC651_011316 [Populus alba x Populus x berolinensis]
MNDGCGDSHQNMGSYTLLMLYTFNYLGVTSIPERRSYGGSGAQILTFNWVGG